jgi:hypothetical protein
MRGSNIWTFFCSSLRLQKDVEDFSKFGCIYTLNYLRVSSTSLLLNLELSFKRFITTILWFSVTMTDCYDFFKIKLIAMFRCSILVAATLSYPIKGINTNNFFEPLNEIFSFIVIVMLRCNTQC